MTLLLFNEWSWKYSTKWHEKNVENHCQICACHHDFENNEIKMIWTQKKWYLSDKRNKTHIDGKL